MSDFGVSPLVVGDDRGELVVLEHGTHVPFEIRRVYFIRDVPAGTARGGHAHHRTRQLAICAAGACTFEMESAEGRQTRRLTSTGGGLLIEPMVWHWLTDFEEGTVVVLLADALYDEADYIRSHDEFKGLLA